MVFADWTTTVSGSGSCSLDGATKYAGVSSCKIETTDDAFPKTVRLTHDTFLETQAQVITWLRQTPDVDPIHPRIKHSSYGSLDVAAYTTASTWERFRTSFWYDLGSNTKWGRIEKYVAGAWVQQGGDTNFGAGSPAAGTIGLENYCASGIGTNRVWFDEVEVYS